MDENTYIVYNENNKAIIIDPGFETDKILVEIEKLNLNVSDILLTHGHFDHMFNIDVLKQKTGAMVWVHLDEKSVITDINKNYSASFFKDPFIVIPDNYFEEGNHNFNGIELKILHTPGHTQGSCCFLCEKLNVVFTGDTIFRANIGRSDFETGDHDQLINSIRNKIFTLPDETIIMPGHHEETTVSFEKNNNPYLNVN